MRVLVFGAQGMLGHKVSEVFSQHGAKVFATVHNGDQLLAQAPWRPDVGIIDGVSAIDVDSVLRAFVAAKPNVVINCIGIVKQKPSAKDCITSIRVNSLFPHQLAEICGTADARLMQISTDCVYSGKRGRYAETDEPDPVDLYGRTKLLGEVTGPGCLTLRTSIIGRQLYGSHGLVEWFLSQNGATVKGYTNAIFSGFTTHSLAEILFNIASEHPSLEGLYHVASDPINKYELLQKIKEAFKSKTTIEPDATLECDRSLKSEKFLSFTSQEVPSWDDMIHQLGSDRFPYATLRRKEC